MNIDSLPNNVLVKILAHLDLKDILSLTQVRKTFAEIRNWEILWSQILRNYMFVSPLIKTPPPIQLKSFEYLQHIFDKLRKVKGAFDHVFKEQNITIGLGSRELSVFDHNRAQEIISNFTNHWAGSLPLELYLFYLIYSDRSINSIFELNKRENLIKLLGGFSFYDNYFEFAPVELHPPECIFFYNFGFYTVIREVNNAVFIMMDTKNQLGFGDSALFSILNINQGKYKQLIISISLTSR